MSRFADILETVGNAPVVRINSTPSEFGTLERLITDAFIES